MIEYHLSNEHLPPAERFDAWNSLRAAQSQMPSVIRSSVADDYLVRARLLDFGVMRLFRMTFPPTREYRTSKLIARSDPEVCHVSFSLRGWHTFEQAGREATWSRSGLLVTDSSHPFQGTITAEDPGGEHPMLVTAEFPRTLLPFKPDAVSRLLSSRLPSEGLGGLLVQCLTELSHGSTRHTPADGARVSSIAVDLITALCAHFLEAETAVEPETHHRVLVTRIRSFIERNLSDPDLTPATIAAAHHISTSHLHHLFSGQGTTVAALIRERRLQRCRHDLTDPAMDAHPIHVIAARWGFTSSAHFSRLFRAAFSLSPRDYRNLR
ncbi:helix-turn-helix domain-containing protein [Actinomadura roseirufa]|uniref:helix-turn-helix domain-containing protein n=1 Tax=Actinomadura roseirufa TaxID=2094049 RepID=UPI0010419826|nr:helix-turn-helix domain-containing protein [Actinomadura roseirufa]